MELEEEYKKYRSNEDGEENVANSEIFKGFEFEGVENVEINNIYVKYFEFAKEAVNDKEAREYRGKLIKGFIVNALKK